MLTKNSKKSQNRNKSLSPRDSISKLTALIKILDSKNPFEGVYFKLFLFALFLILSSLILTTAIFTPQIKYKVGDVALYNVKAPRDIMVKDIYTTRAKQKEAVSKVLPIYKKREETKKKALEKLSVLRNLVAKKKYTEKDIEKIVPNIDFKSFSYLVKKGRLKPEDIDKVASTLKLIFDKGILKTKKGLPKEIMIEEGGRKRVYTSQLYDLSEAKSYIRSILPKDKRKDRFYEFLLNFVVLPNLELDEKATQSARERAKRSVKPVYYKIKKGEAIIREGERIKSEDLAKLSAIYKNFSAFDIITVILSKFFILFISSVLLYLFGKRFVKGFGEEFSDIMLLFLLSLITLLLARLSLTLGSSLYESFLSEQVFYLVPFALGAIVITLVLSPYVSLLFSIFISILVVLLKGEYLAFAFPLLGSLAGILGVHKTQTRSQIILSGILVGITNIFLFLSFLLSKGAVFMNEVVSGSIFSFFGGFLSGIFALGITPIVEYIFGYVTDIKLLELASLDHPLLKELLINALGTYHHSLVVGSMVEAAAKEIGSNPLLAKVGAYFHDIGKIKKPGYFIENQDGAFNIHKKLAPSMSSLIIISHVKDGVEIAKKYHLGKKIIDIIKQHHGTSLITYFYQKAKEMNKEKNVDEFEYRYPGPKPQTKEAALVLLADAVEAASKSLTDPSPARIKGLVKNVINNIYMDGQLDECELTFSDLKKVSEIFTKVLIGIFHKRVKYPEPQIQKL